MAEKHENHKKESKREGGKKKGKKLHAILTTRADDGGFVHEHHYKSENGSHEPPRYGGVSSDLADLHQHMDDHFGDGADQGQDAEPDPNAGGDAQPAAGAPDPNAGAPGQ